MAQAGGGELLQGDPKDWKLNLDPQGSRIIEYGRNALWDRWWVMAGLLAILFLEWSLRRRWILASPTLSSGSAR